MLSFLIVWVRIAYNLGRMKHLNMKHFGCQDTGNEEFEIILQMLIVHQNSGVINNIAIILQLGIQLFLIATFTIT